MSIRKIAGSKNLKIKEAGWWVFATYSFDIPGTRWEIQMNHSEYQKALDHKAKNGAVLLIEPGGEPESVPKSGRRLWWANDGLFWADADLQDEEVALLVQDRQRKHQARLDRLRRTPKTRQRDPIPRDVQAVIWKRDNGRCVRCGTEEDLQFDHIIPVAKGGGNAADNIQVLCGDCNRRKSDSIG